ncbi:MAG: molybdopterin-binding/glycosyltransferase family 2 protein, partial [Myxococcota bacterium]
EVPLPEAEGCLLAHTHRLPPPQEGARGTVLKKGRRLGAEELAAFEAAGFTSVWAARLETGDIVEDDAATRLAATMVGPGVRAEAASTGRVNLFATVRGVFVVHARRIDAVNLVDARLTVATVAPHQVVDAGAMVATVKIIPFAVPRGTLEAAQAAATSEPEPLLEVRAFAGLRTALLLTELPGVAAVQLDRAEATQRARLEYVEAKLEWCRRVAHDHEILRDAVKEVLDDGAELVLMLGASAMVDVDDVLPAAVEGVGGELLQVGMPVDPGNLLVLGRRGRTAIVGVPGCARSPKRSGFDAVLERLAAEIPVGGGDIQRMGVGGLLLEIPSRPRPRQREAPRPRPARVAGIVLAAGRSTRMGVRNKLLQRLDGVPMVTRVVDQLLEAPLDPLLVVVGHEAEDVRAALRGRPVKFVDNREYAEGMGTSLRAGVRALDTEVDGAVVALGDMPFVTAAHVEQLIGAFEGHPPRIVIPVRDGRRGHPVLFGAGYFEEMRGLSGDVGARELLQRHRAFIREITIDDDAIYLDVDTPEALAAVAAKHELEIDPPPA